MTNYKTTIEDLLIDIATRHKDSILTHLVATSIEKVHDHGSGPEAVSMVYSLMEAAEGLERLNTFCERVRSFSEEEWTKLAALRQEQRGVDVYNLWAEKTNPTCAHLHKVKASGGEEYCTVCGAVFVGGSTVRATGKWSRMR